MTFLSAAGQIGSDRAAIRLAGVIAMVQLADEWGDTEPKERQTCIDVLCAYLRMPWPSEATDELTAQEPLNKRRGRDEESGVRETILRLIADHLNGSMETSPSWSANDFNFRRAELPDVMMNKARFDGNLIALNSMFVGHASFYGATFSKTAVFVGATFCMDGGFRGATFHGGAGFYGATFTGDARFEDATFHGSAQFRHTTFTGQARFDEGTFDGRVQWDEAVFCKPAVFDDARFSDIATFKEVKFQDDARFNSVLFSDSVWFDGASFSQGAMFIKSYFVSSAWFKSASFTMNANVNDSMILGALVQVDGSSEEPGDEPRPFHPELPENPDIE